MVRHLTLDSIFDTTLLWRLIYTYAASRLPLVLPIRNSVAITHHDEKLDGPTVPGHPAVRFVPWD